eukprot:gene18753-22428_t
MLVNKTELIDHIAEKADISKAAAARALDAVIGGVTETLKNNDSVTLVGFGTFSVSERAERTGRNPRTKEAITIEAAKVPKFKAGCRDFRIDVLRMTVLKTNASSTVNPRCRISSAGFSFMRPIISARLFFKIPARRFE